MSDKTHSSHSLPNPLPTTHTQYSHSAANKRPYDSLRIQISKVSGIADIGSVFSKAVTPNHLLSLILKETLDLTGADVCMIWLKERTGRVNLAMSFGLKKRLTCSMASKLGSGIIKRVMERSGPAAVDDLIQYRGIPMKRIIRSEGLRSMLASPLCVADEKIGVLMVFNKKPGRTSDVDKKVFAALAGQSALAIANVGLYEKLDKKVRDSARDMSMLFTMSRSLSSSVDQETVLGLILEKARMIMKARFCVLQALDNSRKRLSVMAGAGARPDNIKRLVEFEKDPDRNILRSGSTFVINDVNTYCKRVPAYIRKHDIHSFLAVPLYSAKRKSGILSVYTDDTRIFDKEEIALFEMVANLCSVAIDNSSMLERIRKDYLNMVKTLAKIIDANDSYTHGHCDKVMRYSIGICRRLGLPERVSNVIKTASMLHDIGKIGVDLSILHKKDQLTDEEWANIRRHPEIGARIIAQVGFLNDVVPIVRHHHSRYGGGGYPDPQKRRDKIPIGSRVIAVADAYDAMTSDRSYRKALSREEALFELRRCAGKQFDPKVVDAFVKSKAWKK